MIERIDSSTGLGSSGDASPGTNGLSVTAPSDAGPRPSGFLADDLAAPDTRPEDVIPLVTKVSFGFASMLPTLSTNLTKELLNPVFVVLLGLSPAVVGIAMIVYRLYDAFYDAFIGWASDNTRSRMGRRRPYLLVGAFLSAAAMPLVWQVDRGWSHTTLTIWLIGSGIVLYTFASTYGVPYESFFLELTPDYKERTRASSFKMVISSLAGLLIGWSWRITQLPMFNDPVTGKPDVLAGARAVCTLGGVLALVFGLLPVFTTRERFYESARKQARVPMRESFAATFRSRPFLILSAMSLLAVTGTGLAGGIGFFTRLYYVCQGDSGLASSLNGWQATLWLPVSIASVFLFQAIANRRSKTYALAVAFGMCLASLVFRWWTYRPDMPYLSLATTFLLGGGITGLWQMVPAMNADVVDADEVVTSRRREGAFASIFSWFMKLSFTAGVGLPGIIVQWCGFISSENVNQRPGVMFAIRLSEVLIPGVFLVGAILLLARYPLSVRRMVEIRRTLEARRGDL